MGDVKQQWLSLLREHQVVTDESCGIKPIFATAYNNVAKSKVQKHLQASDQLHRDGAGRLTFDDAPVFVYNRRVKKSNWERFKDLDIASLRDNAPKVHLTYCKKIKEYAESVGISRLYCTNRNTGEFEIDIFNEDSNLPVKENVVVPLHACQYCLEEMFDKEKNSDERKRVAATFNYTEFLNQGKAFNTISWQERSLWIGEDKDFKKVSKQSRADKGYQCTKCKVKVKAGDERFIHTHHKDRDRYFNHRVNLEVLCIRCHAEMPGHEHMKSLDNYRIFVKKYGRFY